MLQDPQQICLVSLLLCPNDWLGGNAVLYKRQKVISKHRFRSRVSCDHKSISFHEFKLLVAVSNGIGPINIVSSVLLELASGQLSSLDVFEDTLAERFPIQLSNESVTSRIVHGPSGGIFEVDVADDH